MTQTSIKSYFYSLATDQRNGMGSGLMKIILHGLAILYGLGLSLTKLFYEKKIFEVEQLPKPVISVGNLTLGGVGKTPLVIYLAKMLQKNGFRPVVLIRGYRHPKGDSLNSESDESILLREELKDIPVLVGRNRAFNAKEFLKENDCDIFLMDDGFQHWRLFRDMDILAVDATNPWGNGHLIPRGILREPITAALRAEIYILTKTDLKQGEVEGIKQNLLSINPHAMVIQTIHAPDQLINLRTKDAVDKSRVNHIDVCALSAIGDPLGFQKTLENIGANIKMNRAFIDHYEYNNEDIIKLGDECRQKQIRVIVTTQKDCAKLEPFLSALPKEIEIYYLHIKLSVLCKEEQLIERISSILHR